MKKIDLQTHTTASDGILSPKQLVDLAIKKGMKAIAITDHDTIAGISEAINHALDKNIEIVPGVEISCREEEFKPTIDVIGLFINYKNKELNNFLERFRNERINEKKEMIKKLNNLGYEITFNELIEESGDSIGRPTIARILIRKYPEKFSSIEDVFSQLIGDGKKAFVSRKKSSMEEAINIIKTAGGIPILAHPGRYFNNALKIIEKFVLLKGAGIEIDYPYEKLLKLDFDLRPIFKKIAIEKGLFVSGGSDFHDFERGVEIGESGIDEAEFLKLKQYFKN